MSADPIAVNPELYRVIFENERVRILEYRDEPGDRTQPHHHPDSVLYPLTSFRRRISANGQQVEVALTVGQVRWGRRPGTCGGEHRRYRNPRTVHRTEGTTTDPNADSTRPQHTLIPHAASEALHRKEITPHGFASANGRSREQPEADTGDIHRAVELGG
ncbi:hypothetical protein [Nocardia sp. CA-119907]|uniref:hypothetical protein n=1 Tax=Nocardia sp. CA-119907 TaxID=3239973 RepID=UPI003D95159E